MQEMSRGGILEEHVSCAVCLEVYTDPHALRCLHTFCKPCIDQLHKHGRRNNPEVECPECRERTKINQLRKDFKMQTLIDSYNSKQEDMRSDQVEITEGALCGMCNVAGKAMHSQCVECEHNMCKECDAIHRGMKITKNHTVQPFKDVLTQLRSDVEYSMICLQKKKDHCKKKSACIKNSIDNVMQSNKEQLLEVDGCFNRLVDELRKVQSDLRKKISCANGQTVNQLMQQGDMFDKIGDDLESYIHSFTDIMNSDNITELSKIAKDIELIKKEIKIPCMENITNSPVNVINMGKFDAKDIMDVEIVESEKQNHNENCLKWRLLQSKYREVKRQTLDFFAGGICFNNGQIFCGNCSDGSIEEFDQELNLLRSFKHPKLEFIRRIFSINEKDMLAICDAIRYVQLYGTSSIHVTTIAEDDIYADVCMHDNSIFALDFYNGQIHVFKDSDKNTNWVKVIEYNIQHYNMGAALDRLYVNQKEIMVSSFTNDCVLLYDKQDGTYKAKFDEIGISTREDGAEDVFYGPQICNVISCCENVLVSCAGGAFQILSSQGEWDGVLFEKGFKHSVDAAIDAAIDPVSLDMYVIRSISTGEFELVKFSF